VDLVGEEDLLIAGGGSGAFAGSADRGGHGRLLRVQGSEIETGRLGDWERGRGGEGENVNYALAQKK
jgi:hypothetical protein